jgi:predicted phosphodiesterase
MAPTPQSLALIGDIHARLDALTAVLDAITAAGIPTGLCTGDVVMRGPEPAACIARVRELGWPTVVGNTDRKVAAGRPRAPSHPASGRIGSRSWTYRELARDDRAWLRALPTLVRVSFGGARVVVIHGDAESLPYPINADTSSRDIERQLRVLKADVLVVGHTHVSMVRTVRNGTVINPGAVGESRTPDSRPRWAWLEATPEGIVPHLEVVHTPLAPQRDDHDAPED